MNVISLDRARAQLRTPRRIEPPWALTSGVRAARQAHAEEDDSDDRLRMRQNLAASVVIVVIVTVGTWLMSSLHDHARLRTCIEAGHRNCLPLAPTHLASPYWH